MMNKEAYHPSCIGIALGGNQVLLRKILILDISAITFHVSILIPFVEVKELQET